eukprot:5077225-Prymnesium_polylepis.1
MARESLRKPWRKRAKARDKHLALKLQKWPPLGMPKAAKVTHPPDVPQARVAHQVSFLRTR